MFTFSYIRAVIDYLDKLARSIITMIMTSGGMSWWADNHSGSVLAYNTHTHPVFSVISLLFSITDQKMAF